MIRQNLAVQRLLHIHRAPLYSPHKHFPLLRYAHRHTTLQQARRVPDCIRAARVRVIPRRPYALASLSVRHH
jgi:hypothetical protein